MKRKPTFAPGCTKENSFPFRVILRGNKGDQRKRAVRTVYAKNHGDAMLFAATIGETLVASTKAQFPVVDFFMTTMPHHVEKKYDVATVKQIAA